MRRASARERIAGVFDLFDEFGASVEGRDPIVFQGYHETLAEARERTGEREAVICGVASLDGHQVVAAVFEFGFIGGSLSEAAGSKLEAAMQKAAAIGRPFVAVTSSGGARMQEGMAALAQMPRTVAASWELGRAGLPRISVLCHPTTGGVYASFASLSDFTIAEAGATIGFAGPRVAEAMSGERLPQGSHTAEAALRAGLVDAVVPTDGLRAELAKLLAILEGPR